jgi:hypothetical protein
MGNPHIPGKATTNSEREDERRVEDGLGAKERLMTGNTGQEILAMSAQQRDEIGEHLHQNFHPADHSPPHESEQDIRNVSLHSSRVYPVKILRTSSCLPTVLPFDFHDLGQTIPTRQQNRDADVWWRA